MKSHKDSNEVLPLRLARTPTMIHKNQEPPGPHTITHNDEKIALVLVRTKWFCHMEYLSMNSSLQFCVLRYTKSYTTPDV